MPLPSCPDPLSHEIYEPVHDPLTGLCYRNPCAAEEAGVVDWVPGCVIAEPVYAPSTDVIELGPGWVDAIWSGGGGGRRRRRRHHRPGGSPPGGGRFGPRFGGRTPPSLLAPSPGGSLLAPSLPSRGLVSGAPTTNNMASARTPLVPGALAPMSYKGTPVQAATATASPAYSYAGPRAMATLAPMRQPMSYRSTPMSSAPMRAATPTYSYAGPRATAKGLKGLGQMTTAATTTPMSMAPPVMSAADREAQFGNRFDPIYRFRQVWIDPPPVVSHYADGYDVRGSGLYQWIVRAAAAAAALAAAGVASRMTKSRGVIAGAGVAGLLVAPMAFRSSYLAQTFSMW